MTSPSALVNQRRPQQLLWGRPPPAVALDDRDVHVWCSWLDRPADEVLVLERSLAPVEAERVTGFRFARDRDRFIVRRSWLRAILSSYTGMPPSQIAFDVGPNGKPILRGTRADRKLDFNISHSDGLALFAITRGRPLGVDVERVRPLPGLHPLVERFFSPREQRELALIRDSRKVEAFFHGWTRKEAYLKATGCGLTESLTDFDVSLAPDEPARIVCVRGDLSAASRWSLDRLMPAAGYAAALALEGSGLTVSRWRWGEPGRLT